MADITATRVGAYFDRLVGLLHGAIATTEGGAALTLDAAFERIAAEARRSHARGSKLIFIGNGGSAGIASHLAIDFSKNGNLRALAFNDGPALTCLANDFGYEQVFAKQIEMHGQDGDMLVAISSSGRSANILNGVAAAREAGMFVATLSGFAADNPLRRRGDVNMYIADGEYGFVEVGHLALCHAILDLATTSWPKV